MDNSPKNAILDYLIEHNLVEITDEASRYGLEYDIEKWMKGRNNKVDAKKGQFVVIDIRNLDYMKHDDGNIIVYDTAADAAGTCGMYETEDAWVCELIYNHVESDLWPEHNDYRK